MSHPSLGRVSSIILTCAVAVTQANSALAQGSELSRARAPELRAHLNPLRSTTLSAETAARIDRLDIQEGKGFKSGQLLVQFDCSGPRAQLRKIQASLDGARKSLDVQNRLSQLDSAGNLEVTLAASKVAELEAEGAMVRANIDKCAIHAPFEGRVADLKVKQYQFVAVGQPLMEILDSKELQIELIAPSRWLSWMKVGHRFQIVIDENGRAYPAEVTTIGARIDPVSQSVKLISRVSGHFEELLPGMSGRALFNPPE